MITLTGPLKVWTGAEGSMHFMSLPDDMSDEVRVHAMETPRGFRSVKVEAHIRGVTWRTSLFPVKSGGYFLPVKIEVCRRAAITAGEQVTVKLELL